MSGIVPNLVVFYTGDDDGIWLRCTDCDWRENVGFDPELGPLIRVEQVHRRKRHNEENQR